ncbi:MAG: dolichol kinase [Ignavibacteriales bacterium]|nr:dolichol kinase [Ignavibacteriales bacterium]
MIENDYRIEVIRKAIHLVSLSIPIVYYFLSKQSALAILIPMTTLFLVVDITRHYYKPVEELFFKYFGFLLRRHESDKKRKTLNGASYVLISAALCVLVFPKIITLTSFSILIISDISAALIGRKFGKHRFLAKSLEGSSAFFISGLVVILITPKIGYHLSEYLIALIAVVVGTIIEALPATIDDNFSIPVSVGAVLWLGYTIFLPSLNIYILG